MKPPALIRDELIAIRERNIKKRNWDVWRLLHDVSRLRGLLVRIFHYFSLADAKYQYADDIRLNLIAHLKDEPCVQEDKQLHEELREEMRKVRRGEIISKKATHDEANGILNKVPGFDEAVSQLPPPAIAENRPYIVEVEAKQAGRVRIYFRQCRARNNDYAHWYWDAYRAERVE